MITTVFRLRAVRLLLVAVGTAVPATAGCSASRPHPAAAAEPVALAPAELEALYRARADSARARHTTADVHFMSGMIAHHAQALLMARLAATHGASEPVVLLAARISSAQQDEIEAMQSWLRERGQPVPEPHIAGTTLTVHGADHAMHTRGMLTAAQLRELDAARGRDFDRLFLLFMIEHHRGAVAMVRELFASHGAARDPALFRLASEIQADQTAEIARMLRLLAELSASTEPRS
jgi:uncharacterized protein (DUF305 family)